MTINIVFVVCRRNQVPHRLFNTLLVRPIELWVSSCLNSEQMNPWLGPQVQSKHKHAQHGKINGNVSSDNIERNRTSLAIGLQSRCAHSTPSNGTMHAKTKIKKKRKKNMQQKSIKKMYSPASALKVQLKLPILDKEPSFE